LEILRTLNQNVEGLHKSAMLNPEICMCKTICIGLQPLHCSPLQNVTIEKMKSDNFKALQKWLKAIPW
jgi:hypothetical protein